MKFEHYMKFVQAGVNLKTNTYRERLILAGMGMAGEAGEICDEAKKVAFHGKDLDRDKLIKEMGDVLWYYTFMLQIHGFTLDGIMEANVFKLCDRYPRWHGDPEDVIALSLRFSIWSNRSCSCENAVSSSVSIRAVCSCDSFGISQDGGLSGMIKSPVLGGMIRF